MNVVNVVAPLSGELLIIALLLRSLGKINKKKELSGYLGDLGGWGTEPVRRSQRSYVHAEWRQGAGSPLARRYRWLVLPILRISFYNLAKMETDDLSNPDDSETAPEPERPDPIVEAVPRSGGRLTFEEWSRRRLEQVRRPSRKKSGS